MTKKTEISIALLGEVIGYMRSEVTLTIKGKSRSMDMVEPTKDLLSRLEKAVEEGKDHNNATNT